MILFFTNELCSIDLNINLPQNGAGMYPGSRSQCNLYR